MSEEYMVFWFQDDGSCQPVFWFDTEEAARKFANEQREKYPTEKEDILIAKLLGEPET